MTWIIICGLARINGLNLISSTYNKQNKAKKAAPSGIWLFPV